MAVDAIVYEQYPPDLAMDEADRSLRAHFARMPDQRLAEYDATWSDEQVLAWEPDFRSDGNLMLICCERDIDMEEYRAVLEQHIELRRKNGAKI